MNVTLNNFLGVWSIFEMKNSFNENITSGSEENAQINVEDCHLVI